MSGAGLEQVRTIKGFCKWLLTGLVIGLLVGGIGTLFHHGIEFVTAVRVAHPWILFFLPVAGVAIVALYRLLGIERDKGTNLVLLAVREGEPMTLRHMLCIFTASLLTHLCGGSSGREGAALQIGGSVAAQIGEWLHLDEDDVRILVMCGMSACFSALFGTPIAAAVFTMEVISVGILHYSALVPCVVSALVGCGVSGLTGVRPMAMTVELPGMSVLSAVHVGAVATLCAALSYVFCVVMHQTGKLYRKWIPNTYLRAAVGGALVILCTLLIGSQKYNGAGSAVILEAFQTRQGYQVFLLKLILTALTLGAGFKGGEIVPVFFMGATFGSALSGILGISPSFGAAIGLLAMFCGVTNCPLATLLLGVELFGSDGIAFYGLAVAVSYMLSGYQGLYSEQKILYSKVRPRFINRKIGDRKP